MDSAATAASRGYKRAVIAAFVRSSEAQSVAGEIGYIDVRILDGEETARLLKSLNAANAYLFAAVLTFVFSRFVRHSIYYIVAAAALLALSFAARFIRVGNDGRDKGKTRA